MNRQERDGIEVAFKRKIVERDGYWLIERGSNPFLFYRVDLKDGKCECEQFRRLAPRWCKHLYAVRYLLESQKRPPKKVPRPPSKKSPRNWPLYHDARAAKHRDFKELLLRLCRGLPPDIPSKMGGRPRVPLSAMVYAAVMKVRSHKAGKEMESVLEEEDEADRLPESRMPKANTLLSFFSSTRACDVLNKLIGETCASFEYLERTFAIDSTHFPVPRRDKDYDFKTGKATEKLKTFKAHVSSGILTNVIASIRVTPNEGKGSADAAQFPNVLRETIERFRVLEILADSAYCSHDNYRCAEEVGAKLYAKFGSRDTKTDDSAYGRALLFQKQHPREHLSKFRQRSMVESTFSMLKRDNPGKVFFKSDRAIENEITCMALVHNIDLLVRARYELGMTIEFWKG